jgi:hypothetical protein
MYTKQIVSLFCYADIDGETDVTFTINWYLSRQKIKTLEKKINGND